MAAHNGKAKLVGVLGDPISHSLSPAIHEYWLQKYGINGAYVPLRIKAERFEKTLEMLLDSGFVGFNVTLPHKERAFDFAQSHDTASQICRAANTLVLQANGNVHAMNSDAFGFVKMMESMDKLHPIDKKCALLLGAGGAARAIVLGLQMLEVEKVVVANRTLSRAEELVAQLQQYAPRTKLVASEIAETGEYAAQAGVVINSLAIGSDTSEIMSGIIAKSHKAAWIADISYGKGNGTETTRMAKEAGRKNVDGITMLLWQALSGFEQWFNVTPEVDEGLVNAVKKAMKS